MAAQGKDAIFLEHQVKLDRQRQMLDQKRRVKQQQVNTGMIKASGIGSRPTSSRSNRTPGSATSLPVANVPVSANATSVPIATSVPTSVPVSNATSVLVSNAASANATSLPMSSANATSVPVSNATSVPVSNATSVPVSNAADLHVPVSNATNVSNSTSLPVTSVPTTSVPATSIPATSVPATSIPATSVPAISTPATSVPVTSVPATSIPVSNDIFSTAPLLINDTTAPVSAGVTQSKEEIDHTNVFSLKDSCEEIAEADVVVKEKEVPVDDQSTAAKVSLAEKLLSLGLQATIGGGYGSDSSEDENESGSKLTIVSPDRSPVHETSVLPKVTEGTDEFSSENSNPLDIRVIDGIPEELSKVVFKVPKENDTVQCRITRDKQGLDKHMYPLYYLNMEEKDSGRVFLLASRKKKGTRSSYYTISTDPANLSRDGDSFVAKLRSNFVGTSFTVYDNGHKPPANPDILREELALINYETNLLGFKGPRKMSVTIPALDKNHQRICVRPATESDTLVERCKNEELNHLVQLHNKQPIWSADSQAYVLNFHGRVTQASVKNFQLVHASNEEYVVLQFGRIAEDEFTLDYRFPMCAVQAFAIALSSFDSKWACE